MTDDPYSPQYGGQIPRSTDPAAPDAPGMPGAPIRPQPFGGAACAGIIDAFQPPLEAMLPPGMGFADLWQLVVAPPFAYMQQSVALATAELKQVFAQNPRRRYLMVQNNGAGDVYVGFDVQASAVNGFKLAAGQTYELTNPATSSAVWLFAAAATSCIVGSG